MKMKEALPCRRCGELPEFTFIYGRDYGYPLEDKAQGVCYKCGNRARPAFGWHGADDSILKMAVNWWNSEQRKKEE